MKNSLHYFVLSPSHLHWIYIQTRPSENSQHQTSQINQKSHHLVDLLIDGSKNKFYCNDDDFHAQLHITDLASTLTGLKYKALHFQYVGVKNWSSLWGARTEKAIKHLHFSSFYGVKPPAI